MIALALVGVAAVAAGWDAWRRWLAVREIADRKMLEEHSRVLADLATWRGRIDEERRHEGMRAALGRR